MREAGLAFSVNGPAAQEALEAFHCRAVEHQSVWTVWGRTGPLIVESNFTPSDDVPTHASPGAKTAGWACPGQQGPNRVRPWPPPQGSSDRRKKRPVLVQQELPV